MKLKFEHYSLISYLISSIAIVYMIVALKNNWEEVHIIISTSIMSLFLFAPTAYKVGYLIYRLVRKILTL